MSDQSLYDNILMLAAGIDTCLHKNLVTPALILIYSAIDTIGWLNSEGEYSTRQSFVDWVDSYLLKAKRLPCSAIDLYAARCGMLHTFTSESQLYANGKAKKVFYSWGKARPGKLQNVLQFVGEAEAVVVHVNDLYEGWRMGAIKFAEDIAQDKVRAGIAYTKAKRFFSNIPG